MWSISTLCLLDIYFHSRGAVSYCCMIYWMELGPRSWIHITWTILSSIPCSRIMLIICSVYLESPGAFIYIWILWQVTLDKMQFWVKKVYRNFPVLWNKPTISQILTLCQLPRVDPQQPPQCSSVTVLDVPTSLGEKHVKPPLHVSILLVTILTAVRQRHMDASKTDSIYLWPVYGRTLKPNHSLLCTVASETCATQVSWEMKQKKCWVCCN